MIKIFIIFCYLAIINFSAESKNIGSETGFKIPRFVSLKSNDVNLRIGSGLNYPLVLNYKKKHLPVEIIDEYDSWRQIVDIDGNTGWIHKNLLKGDRFGIIYKTNDTGIKIFNKPNGLDIASIGDRNIVSIEVCLNSWCKIKFDKIKGWIQKKNLWGVYEKEEFNIPIYQIIIDQVWKINFYKLFKKY